MAQLEQQEVKATPDKPSKKPMIITAAISGVLSMLIGAGGTYFAMKHFAPPVQTVEGGVVVNCEQEEKHVEVIYVDLTKALTVNFSQNSMFKVAKISLAVTVENEEALPILKKNEPMIFNDLLMLIGAQDPLVLQTREGKEALRTAVQENMSNILKKVARKNYVREIFFTSFIMQ